jgi:hypothetical protein
LENGVCNDVAELKIWDLYVTKWVLYSELFILFSPKRTVKKT